MRTAAVFLTEARSTSISSICSCPTSAMYRSPVTRRGRRFATRIAALYFIGAHAPGAFHTMHQEVFQLALLVLTCALFVLWAFHPSVRTSRSGRPPEASQAGA